MIVDDAKYMREMLEEIVETSEGYEIAGVAADGEEAIAKYLELMDAGLRPDIVTMDIVMPNADGIAVIRELKRYDPDARILAISALGSPDTIDRAMDAGAQDYITKPFSDMSHNNRVLYKFSIWILNNRKNSHSPCINIHSIFFNILN